MVRRPNGRQIPDLISGSGGFAATAPKGPIPKAPVTVGDQTLEVQPIIDFGYLTLETDGKTYLSATFKIADKQKGVVQTDIIKVDLSAGTLSTPSKAGKVPNASKAVPRKPASKRSAQATKTSRGRKR